MSSATRELRERIERLTTPDAAPGRDEARSAVVALLEALGSGQVRAAEPGPDGWRAVPWVKSGILLAFRTGATREYVAHPAAPNPDFGGSTIRFFDRDTLPLRDTEGVEENVRIVPGGSSVRAGSYLGPGVVMMPPAFVNIGAYVDEGAMIDSHALVGSCAQVGKRVHLSAGAQLGGVLEPVGLRPVVIEDDAMVGGNTGIFEGTLVGRRAVIAPGVQLTASTAVYDLVREDVYRAGEEEPLSIPEGAVVVPGSRPAEGGWAKERGLTLYAPVIVKYRDERTDSATALEEALR
ncbi:MAG: 2,3,4,5-tetrahydropyridine-2,6-dicarboxylate N-succinyltransferase [Gemmatimonadota bacterium]|nr:2,3,4,5-tetrahydropyridine-2,6-dicarboxylate N-succinyltransferase [Gemmatimonadota bacterium]